MPPSLSPTIAAPAAVRRVEQPVDQCAGARAERLEEARPRDLVQGREAAGGRDRVAGQGAGLVDGAERRELLHHRALGAERRERHAAADDLAEDADVGLEPGDRPGVEALRAAEADAKPVITSSKTSSAPCSVQSSRRRLMNGTRARTKFMLPAIGSITTQAIFAAVQANASSELGEVVVFEHQRVLHHLRRHAGTGRVAKSGQTGAGLDQQASAWPW